jgi:hypothetical protein
MEDSDAVYSWVGPILSEDAKKITYPAVLIQSKLAGRWKKDRTYLIKLGSKVLVSNSDLEPFIGEVVCLYFDKLSKKMKFQGRWFYRQSDVVNNYNVGHQMDSNELYYSNHIDVNELSVIISICYVVFALPDKPIPVLNNNYTNLFLCKNCLQITPVIDVRPILKSKLSKEYSNIYPTFPEQYKNILKNNHSFWSFICTEFGDIDNWQLTTNESSSSNFENSGATVQSTENNEFTDDNYFCEDNMDSGSNSHISPNKKDSLRQLESSSSSKIRLCEENSPGIDDTDDPEIEDEINFNQHMVSPFLQSKRRSLTSDTKVDNRHSIDDIPLFKAPEKSIPQSTVPTNRIWDGRPDFNYENYWEYYNMITIFSKWNTLINLQFPKSSSTNANTAECIDLINPLVDGTFVYLKSDLQPLVLDVVIEFERK